jgi:hypothetical protein
LIKGTQIIFAMVGDRYGNWAALPIWLALPYFSSVDAIERVVMRRLIFVLWFARYCPYRHSVFYLIYQMVISIDVCFFRSGRGYFFQPQTLEGSRVK